jgi:cation diffusion facilitator family transporter
VSRSGSGGERPQHHDREREQSAGGRSDERQGPVREFELPQELVDQQRKAVRLEWITLAYMLSAVVLLFLTLGQSQAMKAAWIEDLLSLLPPAAFLIASRLRNRSPSEKFPWGMHRAVTVAYVCAALALLVMGAFVFFDSALKLVKAEHPPIGVIQLFGQEVWLGWVMIGALVYSGLPAVFLGRAKLKLADDLHDKVLYADAQMNKADWMTVTAAIVGIIGIGFGLWWADAVAAIFISLDITHDGWKNVRAAVHDLMDARPRRHDAREYHPIVERMNEAVNDCDWVEQSAVRLREEGHVFTGEVLVVPHADALSGDGELVDKLEELAEHLLGLEWKIYDIVVVPVKEIDIPSPGVEPRAQDSSLSGSR